VVFEMDAQAKGGDVLSQRCGLSYSDYKEWPSVVVRFLDPAFGGKRSYEFTPVCPSVR
jgi:hypothetical protein